MGDTCLLVWVIVVVTRLFFIINKVFSVSVKSFFSTSKHHSESLSVNSQSRFPMSISLSSTLSLNLSEKKEVGWTSSLVLERTYSTSAWSAKKPDTKTKVKQSVPGLTSLWKKFDQPINTQRPPRKIYLTEYVLNMIGSLIPLVTQALTSGDAAEPMMWSLKKGMTINVSVFMDKYYVGLTRTFVTGQERIPISIQLNTDEWMNLTRQWSSIMALLTPVVTPTLCVAASPSNISTPPATPPVLTTPSPTGTKHKMKRVRWNNTSATMAATSVTTAENTQPPQPPKKKQKKATPIENVSDLESSAGDDYLLVTAVEELESSYRGDRTGNHSVVKVYTKDGVVASSSDRGLGWKGQMLIIPTHLRIYTFVLIKILIEECRASRPYTCEGCVIDSPSQLDHMCMMTSGVDYVETLMARDHVQVRYNLVCEKVAELLKISYDSDSTIVLGCTSLLH